MGMILNITAPAVLLCAVISEHIWPGVGAVAMGTGGKSTHRLHARRGVAGPQRPSDGTEVCASRTQQGAHAGAEGSHAHVPCMHAWTPATLQSYRTRLHTCTNTHS